MVHLSKLLNIRKENTLDDFVNNYSKLNHQLESTHHKLQKKKKIKLTIEL